MDIFGVGGPELLVVMLLAVIVLGPERMARAAREAGKHIRNFKAYFSALSDELKTEIDLLDELKDLSEVKRDLTKK
jgi:Tat protein translocase TatB subunit